MQFELDDLASDRADWGTRPLSLSPHAPAEEPVRAPHSAALAELALAVGGFALGTGEFASMGLLPSAARSVRVSIPTAGHMISAYALGVVIGAPIISVLMARAPRRAMLIGLMIVFALANAATALAPAYLPLVAARFLAGLPHGAYFGIAALVAASLAGPDGRAQAVGRVMLGLSVANVVGVPFATWLGQWLGWRAAFWSVCGLGILTAALVSVFVPVIPVHGDASPRRELAGFRRPQVWLTLGVAAVGFGGLFAVYSYITPALTRVTGIPLASVPLFLSVIGLGMIAGSLVGGWFADRARMASILGGLVWSGVVLAFFAVASAQPWTALVDLFLMGGVVAIVPALQTRLMDTAGDAQTLAAALNHSAFNLANALGAWLGGLAIAAGFGWTSTGWIGAALALAAVPILALSVMLDRPRLGRRRLTLPE
ncbi:MAG TPA: MFS transporter [Caulobacteraceae bacterium]|jgi:DHA1 family inner membrane transport protein|nr:MFS transporter [Caulobacteraceae bacterium]